MPKLSQLLAAAVFAVSAVPAFAQVGSLSDGSLAMGEKVEAVPQAAPTGTTADVSSELHGDWDLQCAKEGVEPRPCRMYQLMNDQNGSPISEITLFKLPAQDGNAVAGATIIVPLETLLPAQLTIAIDGENAQRYPFAFCNQVGCIARLGLTGEDVDNLKSGSAASIVIVPAAAPDQVVNVTMSLKGFTSAFDKAGPVPN
ncbi:invasion associated locus B family protein [Shimia haliotis]|uniref:Invasion protein IalB, involved in pathogenesis n=1 Tax=Shimia haliotis TaxID=1280847 RepID=A0A1I4B0T0_9RHOB|nr:invasion associated locus B family protein [Shimia haliotis]SFK62143.1 Invasion protein IalB, involved in pathogenesis [Shimia haliotis]